jgi:hypothetical protein
VTIGLMKKTIAAIAAALTLAGCSSSGGGQAGGIGSSDTDACGLLTDDQINQATQLAPKAHAPIANNPLKTCRWDLYGENNLVKIYTGDAKWFADPKGDALAGLGDKAIWDPDAQKVTAIKGGVGFELWIVLLNQTDQERPAATRLANDVAAKFGWGGGAKVPDATSSATKTSTSAPTKTSESSEPTSTTSEPADTGTSGASDTQDTQDTEPSN